MDIRDATGKLKELQDRMSAYRSAMSLISYDGDTTAPVKTAENRAHATGILTAELYRMNTAPETVELLDALDGHADELDEKTRRSVAVMLKRIREMEKIPQDEYVAFRQLLVKAGAVWHEAKEKSDFKLFEPYLQQIFDTKKRFAGYCAPDMHPYDYQLDQYEEGLTMEDCDRFFGTLKRHIVPLLAKIAQCPKPDNAVLQGCFPDAVQEKLAYWLMETLGLDLGHVGLGTTEHPFTTSIGSHHDVRITTRYVPDRFDRSMFSVIHEGGHALYEAHVADDLAYTVLDGGASMSIHESQSRFYENIVGRSRPFMDILLPKLRELIPENVSDTDADALYRAVNRIEPTLIRTEADEVTYSLHVMVRYELEKAVLSGELAVHDLPEAWNRLYREYLGIEVPDDKRVVLQDSHWSGGLIGYFPSYALGNAYGAQFMKQMQKTVDIDACVRAGDLSPVNEWNRTHIWQYGRLYTPSDLLKRVLDGPFDPEVYTSYLEEKYGELYGFRA